MIPLHEIALSSAEPQRQRRLRFNGEQLAELAASIRDHGVLQPIIVRSLRPGVGTPGGEPARYELVAGERRYHAAKAAELETIPAVVRELTDEQVLEVQLIENLQRADLHPMEEAEGYSQLMKVHGHAIEELHARVGKSRSYVYGRLKLLSLSQKCRAAFYADKISASVALLLARIPNEKLQDEALQAVTGEDTHHLGLTLAEARQLIHEHYMLRLKHAPFPIEDETLPGGPCSKCPKRTGNQPELFDDVSDADMCTDPPCYEAKTREQGKRELAAAKVAGRAVMSAAEAKRVFKHGGPWINGYVEAGGSEYIGGKSVKYKKLVPASELILAPHPDTGAVVELIKRDVIERAVQKARREEARTASEERQDDGTRARQRKAKIEKAFRLQLYEELRPLLKDRGPYFIEIAEAMFDRLEHDAIKLLCKVRGFEPPKIKHSWGREELNYRALGDTLKTLSDGELELFVCDCIFVRELMVSTWSDAKPEKLLALAQELGVDAAAIRRNVNRGHRRGESIERRKKTAKKKAKKKAAERKASK